MNDFLRFYNRVANSNGFRLEIYHSSIADWCITVGFKTTYKDGEDIFTVQDCDVELAFAKAQVQLKEWLRENKGGY